MVQSRQGLNQVLDNDWNIWLVSCLMARIKISWIEILMLSMISSDLSLVSSIEEDFDLSSSAPECGGIEFALFIDLFCCFNQGQQLLLYN